MFANLVNLFFQIIEKQQFFDMCNQISQIFLLINFDYKSKM